MRCEVFGRACRFFVPALCAALLLPACASKENEVPEAPRDGMTVNVIMRDVLRCSRISPEIQIADAPAGTEYYDVRLTEFTGDAQELFLGGGSWEHDGSGVIPEGGLTRHYRGPCPPAGRTGSYAFVVSAMNRKSMQPLAVRIYRFTQE